MAKWVRWAIQQVSGNAMWDFAKWLWPAAIGMIPAAAAWALATYQHMSYPARFVSALVALLVAILIVERVSRFLKSRPTEPVGMPELGEHGVIWRWDTGTETVVGPFCPEHKKVRLIFQGSIIPTPIYSDFDDKGLGPSGWLACPIDKKGFNDPHLRGTVGDLRREIGDRFRVVLGLPVIPRRTSPAATIMGTIPPPPAPPLIDRVTGAPVVQAETVVPEAFRPKTHKCKQCAREFQVQLGIAGIFGGEVEVKCPHCGHIERWASRDGPSAASSTQVLRDAQAAQSAVAEFASRLARADAVLHRAETDNALTRLIAEGEALCQRIALTTNPIGIIGPAFEYEQWRIRVENYLEISVPDEQIFFQNCGMRSTILLDRCKDQVAALKDILVSIKRPPTPGTAPPSPR